MKKAFLIFLIFFSFLKAETLKTCYKGYYFFLPLVEDCIIYENGKITAKAHSTPIGSLFKKVEYSGYAIYNKENLDSKKFYFVQKEGKIKFIHEYTFSKDYIFFKKTEYRLKDNQYIFRKKIEKKIKNNNYKDPFTSSIYLYTIVKKQKEGNLNIFYDGKGYKVPFKVLNENETIKVNGKKYKTIKVWLHPNFKTRGLLKPTGNWIIWIDKKLNIPVKMSISFTIGSFNLYLE
ncbi:DUF3108 domain-containing protein [Hydrogenothermus marinus]|uniref:Uncharacterized protein DUF3108 n=1 Tax=Hydrogenothermus marinus TaxID=133270 RepID=A0A3M0BIN7_9AQUI|nr:DUF3108 domain-containing protein [Hydrogenothermus marinus]RMA97250.1 uncharacterized protein DUF3108 [Hydrogenothermus marinus]